MVPVAELGKQVLLGGRGAARSRPQGLIGVPAFAEGQAPAGILAAQARKHRIGRLHGHEPRPVGQGDVGFQAHPAQPGHADPGDTQPGVDPAGLGNPRVDDGASPRPRLDPDAQLRGIVDEALDQGRGKRADAGPVPRAIHDLVGLLHARNSPPGRRSRTGAAPSWWP